MQKKTAQEYADELLKMYRENIRELNRENAPQIQETVFEDGTGGIQVNVTTLGRLYPVKDALVTIFTGQIQNKTAIETDVTNESGKSGIFNLKTPPISESQQAGNGQEAPYASYNISVKSDGYVEQIAMNVPVFSGVVSVQGFDLLPIAAAGKNTSAQIIDENTKYDL